MIGPRANPTPLVPAQKPMARWRSASSRKTSVMMESVEGIMSAAPMPMLARAAISTGTDRRRLPTRIRRRRRSAPR